MSAWYSQGVSERLDYDLEFANWLQGDTIASVSLAATPNGLTVTEDHDADTVKVWASGGVKNTNYDITVTITTATGRVKAECLHIKVKPNGC